MNTLFKAKKNGNYITYGILFLLDRRKDILKLRSEGKTLQEIGNKYGITRERVRQIERKPYACTNCLKYLRFELSDAKDYPKRYKVYTLSKNRYLGYVDYSNHLAQLCYVPCSDHFHTVAELMELEHFMLELEKERLNPEVKP